MFTSRHLGSMSAYESDRRIVSRDVRGVHDDASEAVRVLLVARHKLCGETRHVKGADQIYAKHILEKLQRVDLIAYAIVHCLYWANARAVDEHIQASEVTVNLVDCIRRLSF